MALTTSDVLTDGEWGDDGDHEWLHQLIGDWQLLSDLSFADLALWVRLDDGKGEAWCAAAQVRPTTGISLFIDDLVGAQPSRTIATALTLGTSSAGVFTIEVDDGVMVDVVPVRRDERVIAMLTRHTPPGSSRRRGRLEQTYLGLAQRLLDMVCQGAFPSDDSSPAGRGGAPRVGDGVVSLDGDGRVGYASPNAVSALRRLGLEQSPLDARLADRLDAVGVSAVSGTEEAATVLAGRAPWTTELQRGGASVTVRAVPLTYAGRRTGALLLLRDISELRRRDRALMTKDATIREIHHRVKNNLQTVSALLRLQARRVNDAEATQALADAGRRVGIIADVHEALSEGFDDAVEFDAVAEHGLVAGVELSRDSDAHIETVLEGSFGVLSSEDATSLAMILGELVQNAVEHGLQGRSGTVTVSARRDDHNLHVDVRDNGQGMPETQAPVAGRANGRGGLGTQIVRTFVSDMHGKIVWQPGESGGTVASFSAKLRPVKKSAGPR